MGFEIANNYLEETAFIVAIVGTALAITATVLRFVAVRRANRKPTWEDWFSVLATFFFYLICGAASVSLVSYERQKCYRPNKGGSRRILYGASVLAGILGFVKISEGFGAISAGKNELLDPIWATVQQTCSVICCCAPVYKPLIPEIDFLHTLRSFSSRTFGRSTKSGAQPPSDEMGTGPISVSKIWKHSDDWVQLDERSRGTTESQVYP
ncbi:hypothetical protein G7Y89_g311 [Cudoniella acicularis]|uniref:Uncharacterized protein n=1 Tax=Cudoniella acicularis TaxID=354080 RepID=A0A8H4W8F2_9HELO|nr:hypothetical protein G7Y89_g311 [Cudoniella acicularis]